MQSPGSVESPQLRNAHQEIARPVTRQGGQVGSAGANTSIMPLTSRTSNRGNGASAVGAGWESTSPVGENEAK